MHAYKYLNFFRKPPWIASKFIHEGKWTTTRLLVYRGLTLNVRGGSRIFSRGGGGFSKILSAFFFRSTELIFRAIPTHSLVPVLAKISAPLAKFWKNCPKNAFLVLFGKFLPKNCVFLARAPPSNLVYIGAKGAFRKNFRVGRPKMDFLKSTKGGTLRVGKGSNPWGEGRPPSAPFLNTPLLSDLSSSENWRNVFYS